MCHKQRAKITKLTNKIILTYEYKWFFSNFSTKPHFLYEYMKEQYF